MLHSDIYSNLDSVCNVGKKALNRNKAHECLNKSSIFPAASCCIEGNT